MDMNINLIVANSEKGVIGKNNQIPWHNSKDLKRFKKLTQNSYVIMGRKTFESIGKPLENRVNLVLSKTMRKTSGARIFDSMYEMLIWLYNQEIAFPKANLKAFVIGGSQIYNQFLEKNKIDTIYQTIIKEECDGDRFFNFEKDGWNPLVDEEDENTKFVIWNKKETKD